MLRVESLRKISYMLLSIKWKDAFFEVDKDFKGLLKT